MTDTDVAVGGVLGGDTVGSDGVVDVRRYLVAVAYALAILHDGAVAVGGAWDEFGELQVNLSGLVHDDFGVALETKVVHLGNLRGQVFTDVLVQSQLLDGHGSEWADDVAVVTVSVNVESAEHSPALSELEGQEADDVECGLSHGTTADGNTGADALRRGGDVGEVQSLLSHLGYLTFDGELHVVDAVRDDLCASHTSQHLQVVGQFNAGHLGVDDGLNLHGDQSTGLKVGCGKISEISSKISIKCRF